MLLFTHVTITYNAKKKTIFKISKKVIQIHKICVYFLKRNFPEMFHENKFEKY